MIEVFSNERRRRKGLATPDALRQTIYSALCELRGYSALQRGGMIQEIDPVQRLLLEIAEAIDALDEVGEQLPIIDLTGIDDAFLCGMPSHPILQRIESLLDQQRLKTKLLAKWGPQFEKKRKRLQPLFGSFGLIVPR